MSPVRSRCLLSMITSTGALMLISTTLFAQAQRDKPAPTKADVSYGPHERNVLDFWQAESSTATPLVVYIHGGGFRQGNKSSINVATLKSLLDSGISVAALHYRFMDDAPLPAAHHDCRRALQFLRSKADAWNIDPTRVGAFGGSAGAQLSMYLAFHDEMAQPDSDDPIARQSTRLNCVATTGGQATMDVHWWQAHIPGYETPHRDFRTTFGEKSDEEFARMIADISALSLLSSDDPPIFMSYGMGPDDAPPADEGKVQGWRVHHVNFGIALKERLDELGVESHLKYPGVTPAFRNEAEFFIANLKPADTPPPQP